MRGTVRRILREPLVHFLVLGALLFLIFELQQGGGAAGAGSTRIVVAESRIEHLATRFERTRQRPPTRAELDGLIDDYVREEIAAREARALGLDQDDTVIRERLREKLEFVVDETSRTGPPTDAELQAWLTAHAEDFRVEGVVPALDQVRPAVERRFLLERRKRDLDLMYQHLMEKYSVVVERP